MRSYHLPAHVRRGGFGLLCILVSVFALPFAALGESGEKTYPKSVDELVAIVKSAVETKDFEAIDHVVNWMGISDYKRREFSTQIRHGLGRPIAKVELEQIDDETMRALRNIKLHKLNMQVSHILRITYADGEANGVTPAGVYLVGRMEETYRIALLVKERGTTEND